MTAIVILILCPETVSFYFKPPTYKHSLTILNCAYSFTTWRGFLSHEGQQISNVLNDSHRSIREIQFERQSQDTPKRVRIVDENPRDRY